MTLKKSLFLNYGFSVLFALMATLLCDQVSIGQTPQDRLVPQDYPTPAAALAAANPFDTIVLAPGDYFTNLVINKTITIRGENTSRLLAARGDSPIIRVNSENVRIENLEFSRGITGVEGRPGATNLFISGCVFRDIFGDAIRCTRTQSVNISGCSIVNSLGRGIFLDRVDGFVIASTQTSNNRGSGFDIVADGGIIADCTSQGNNFSGFAIEGSRMGIINCNATANRIGFLLVNTDNLGLQGNDVVLNDEAGVISLGVEDALFADNFVDRNGGVGVLLDDTRRTALQANIITDNSGVGAFYSSSTSDNFAGGNEFRSNGFDLSVVDEGSNFVED